MEQPVWLHKFRIGVRSGHHQRWGSTAPDWREPVLRGPRSDEHRGYQLASLELEQPERKRPGSVCHQRMPERYFWAGLQLEQQWHGEPAWGVRRPRQPGRRHHAGAQLPLAARHGVSWGIRSDSPQTASVILLAVHFVSRSQPAPAFGLLPPTPTHNPAGWLLGNNRMSATIR